MAGKESMFIRMVRILYTIGRNKWQFLVVFLIVFTLSLLALARFDLLPEKNSENKLSTITVASAHGAFPNLEEKVEPEMPLRIVAKSVGVNAPVLNPNTTTISGLDQSLLNGAVRYPTSAKLAEDGNVVIFGHSSYLPVVQNEYFKAFNGLQNLKAGEIIEVYGENHVYRYAVDRVYEADATDTRIDLATEGKKLTLSTCNSFGNLDDRYMVEATFVGSTQISS